jgi:prepilin-type N-terminal cleavage/methylation domain-containing protein
MNKRRTLKAFSLIELSIVILIIGIIIASIIGGKKLVNLSNLSKARALTNSSPIAGIEDLALWLDTTSKNSFISGEGLDGQVITTWNDINPQRTIKNNLTASGSARPTYLSSGLNGLPAIRFDGVDDYLQNTSIDLLIRNQVSIFMVGNYVSGSAGGCVFISQQTDNNNRVSLQTNGVGETLRFDMPNDTTGKLIGNSSLTNKNFIFGAIKTDTTESVYVNSLSTDVTSIANALSATQFSGPLYISSFNGSLYICGMSLGEVIVFNRGLSNFEFQEVMKYLSKKWTISLI